MDHVEQSVDLTVDGYTYRPRRHIAAAEHPPPEISTVYPTDLESALSSNPDGSWWLYATDARWERFGVRAGQIVMIDIDATPSIGDVVAAFFPGDQAPGLYHYYGSMLGDFDGRLTAIHFATTDAPVILGVAERKVTVELMRRV